MNLSMLDCLVCTNRTLLNYSHQILCVFTDRTFKLFWNTTMIIYAYKEKERSICFSTLILNILLSLVLPKLEREIP